MSFVGAGSSSKQSRRAALDQIKAARAGINGQKRTDQYQVKEELGYEEDYDDALDDFVIDDGAYPDDEGDEFWDTQSGVKKAKTSALGSKVRNQTQKKVLPDAPPANPHATIHAAFMKSKQKEKAKLDVDSDAALQDMLADLTNDPLGQLQSVAVPTPLVGRGGHSNGLAGPVGLSIQDIALLGAASEVSRTNTKVLTGLLGQSARSARLNAAKSEQLAAFGDVLPPSKLTPSVHDSTDVENDQPNVPSSAVSLTRINMTSAVATVKPQAKPIQVKFEKMEELESAYASSLTPTAPVAVNNKSSLPPIEEQKFENGGADWSSVNTVENEMENGPGLSPDSASKLSSIGSGDRGAELKMFWFDAYEDPINSPGNVYIFGKTFNVESRQLESCCLIVKNMERNVFALPRSYQLQDADDEESKTDAQVAITDVYKEFAQLAKKYRIDKWAAKPVIRKYAFDKMKDGVPAEAQYLKIVYSAKYPPLPRDLHGRTFSRLFGTKTASLEHFLMKRDLMGPCWIVINHATKASPPVSWCRSEYSVESQKSVSVMEDAPEAPALCVMSLNIKTIINPKTHQNEIVMTSAITHKAVNVDGPTVNPASVSSFTLIRRVNDLPWPMDLQATIDQYKKSKIITTQNEPSLLNLLMARIHNLDPDVIVSHDLHGFGVDVLLHRLNSCKTQFWSKLGRLKRSKMPTAGSKGSYAFSAQSLGAGRLLCDTQVSATELIHQRTYTLTELSKTQLQIARTEMEPIQVPDFFNNTHGLMFLTDHSEKDAWLSLSLMLKLLVLPLTKQLTTLCGNLWSRSLRSQRAERNEFLLMHEFHRLKYICPDKISKKEQDEIDANANANEGKDEDAEGGDKSSKRKKAAYAGGLVLEPKKGFYDKFVLLLDFNSLYPSIIQEYNICFTTVKHYETVGDDLAEVPASDAPNGILPRVIRHLVHRRREVKKLLKSERDESKKSQLDIRQKALKLVANSMYGCLGFVGSRFYCKPMAALITAQGRDILSRTVELARNSLSLDVIYGDTDSVMIDSRTTDLAEAKTIGTKMKQEVNKLYKLLEIEIDAIFQSMLLLKKKKYGALRVVEGPNGVLSTQRETKGLDLVRRDWCELSKDVGNYVLDQILSGAPADEVVEKIHAYLREVGEHIRSNKVLLSKYIINKGLTKEPADYPDAKNLPHVQVALRMRAQGQSVRAGDFIPYIICEGDPSLTLAQRAHHPAAIQLAAGELKIDTQWYLSNQVLPPIVRLCDPIESTDAAKIAHCLGLDDTKFRSANNNGVASGSGENDDDQPLITVAADDEERFRSVDKFKVRCPHCNVPFDFVGVFDMRVDGTSGIKCASPNCKGIVQQHSRQVDVGKMKNQLTLCMRSHIVRYYEGWAQCDDSSCATRSRQVRIKQRVNGGGASCLVTGCKGSMRLEYDARTLFTQLMYYDTLFDVVRAKAAVDHENKQRDRDSSPLPRLSGVLSEFDTQVFDSLHEHTTALLLKDDYFIVKLADYFRRSANQSLINTAPTKFSSSSGLRH